MSTLVQREPAVFLQAVARTCTLDTNRGESMIRLKSARELQQAPNQAAGSAPGSREPTAGATGTAGAGSDTAAAAAGSGQPAPAAAAAGEPAAAGLATPRPAEQRDSGSGDKDKASAPKSAAKPHKKLVPSNFVEVIDALLDVVMGYNGFQATQQQQAASEPAAMELDQQSPRQPGQQQQGQQNAAAAAVAQAAAASATGAGAGDTAPLPVDLLLRKLNPTAREVGIQALVLRLLGDYCLLYSNTVGLLLKRDNEVAPADQRSQHSMPGPLQGSHSSGPAAGEGRTPATARRGSSRHREHSSTGGQTGSESHKAGVVLKHIMHVQLVDQLPPWGSSTNNVCSNASALLQAVCIRSAEGRKRILNELVATLNSSIQGPQDQQQAEDQDKAATAGPLPATVSRADPFLSWMTRL